MDDKLEVFVSWAESVIQSITRAQDIGLDLCQVKLSVSTVLVFMIYVYAVIQYATAVKSELSQFFNTRIRVS